MDGGDNGDSGITCGIETPLRKEEELTDPFILINNPIILFVILLSFQYQYYTTGHYVFMYISIPTTTKHFKI